MSKIVQKLKLPHWSEPALNFQDAMKKSGKAVAYFTTLAGRYGGKRQQVKHIRVHESGLIVYVDTVMFRIGVSSSLSTPFQLRNSTKTEFDREFKKIVKMIYP